ncbi:hypothetical protein DPMN_166092 [Dreissena polymorpha]|uniref:Uncharacterized protein n=1 Tax=Dreissena polymorpha TaxID=45954 RepID=A0A9D4F1L5_DREPO|nr:hypothetical protein DPMN_166092 [Dreissena polymorpha]
MTLYYFQLDINEDGLLADCKYSDAEEASDEDDDDEIDEDHVDKLIRLYSSD